MSWLLIDGNNWFAQIDFANQQGSDTTFVRRLDTVRGQLEHTRCVVCWDAGESFRHGLSASYKAHRGPKPEGFHSRLAKARELLATLPGVDSLLQPTYEADDLIATCVAIAHEEGERAIMFSADKDLHQVLRAGSVSQVTKVTRKSHAAMSFVTVTAASLETTYGVRAGQWVDYRALVGDTSDGIKGCLGIGAKAARELLQWRPSLDDFYKDAWSAPLSGRQMRALQSYQAELPLKRRLLTLVNAVPLPASFFQAPVA